MVVSAGKDAPSIHLRSEKTGELHGPVPLKHGAPFVVGKGTYNVLLKPPAPKPNPQPDAKPAIPWEERYTKKAAEAALAKGDMATIMAIGRMAQAQVDTGKNAMATIVHKFGKAETDEYKAAVEKARRFTKLHCPCATARPRPPAST